LAGNVWEWTASKYDEDLLVLRGGSWAGNRGSARCANRFWFHPFFRYNYVGFRCVRTK
jgi:formylglycine-generating enzyme required for sulfatase activity